MLSIEEFGAHLLTSGDLDPVYIALNKCNFGESMRNRWLVAYCAFYSCGFACYASEREGEAFWQVLMKAAINEAPTPFGSRWPRASERRHFRGLQAATAIKDWHDTYESYPEGMMYRIAEGAPSFIDTLKRAQEHRSIGNWMGFKLVDLVDACMGGEIDQTDVSLFFYDTPKHSLLRLWREKQGYADNVQPKDEQQVIIAMTDYLKEKLEGFEIPHKPGKPVDMFCLETCFCKFQSHLNGHYPLYNDIDEISHGLEPWIPYSSNAKLFLEMMPRNPT